MARLFQWPTGRATHPSEWTRVHLFKVVDGKVWHWSYCGLSLRKHNDAREVAGATKDQCCKKCLLFSERKEEPIVTMLKSLSRQHDE